MKALEIIGLTGLQLWNANPTSMRTKNARQAVALTAMRAQWVHLNEPCDTPEHWPPCGNFGSIPRHLCILCQAELKAALLEEVDG